MSKEKRGFATLFVRLQNTKQKINHRFATRIQVDIQAWNNSLKGILEEERGNGGFGYDVLFFCDEIGQTFGECTQEEKNRVSHRSRALHDLVRQL